MAGAAATGGASLALGIVSLVRGVAQLADKIKDAAQEAEKVEKNLKGDLDTLLGSFHRGQGVSNILVDPVFQEPHFVGQPLSEIAAEGYATYDKLPEFWRIWQDWHAPQRRPEMGDL